MYLPGAFKEERLPTLHEAMRSCGLATLVTVTAEGPAASHLPMLLDAAQGERGTLYAHLARANPQWRDTLPGSRALVIFAGPDCYVSPGWYPSKQEGGRVVPTWNYITVHVEAVPRWFTDIEPLRDLVSRLTDRHEAGRPEPWSIADAPAAYIDQQLRGIVGVALPIDRIEGKWKLSQNRPAADRLGVADGLKDRAGEDAAEIRAAMLERDRF